MPEPDFQDKKDKAFKVMAYQHHFLMECLAQSDMDVNIDTTVLEPWLRLMLEGIPPEFPADYDKQLEAAIVTETTRSQF